MFVRTADNIETTIQHIAMIHIKRTQFTMQHKCSYTIHLDLIALYAKPIFSVFCCVRHLEPF